MNLSRTRHARQRTRAGVAAIMAAGALGLLSLPASGTTYHWVVPEGTWNNGPNWSPFGEPLTGDTADIDYASNAECYVIGTVGNPGNVVIYNGDNLLLQHSGVNDGFLQVSGDVTVGDPKPSIFPPPTAGYLNIFGRQGGIQFTGEGHLAVGGSLNVLGTDFSSAEQGGGTVTIGGGLNLYSGAYYDLLGGVLSAPTAAVNDSSTLYVSGPGVGTFGALSVAFNGRLTQPGGQITVGNSGGGFVMNGTYNLQGGTLTCGAMTVSFSTASVTYQGGSLVTGPLTINQNGQVRLSTGGGKVLRSTSVSVGSDGGGLDLTDNAMIVDYTGASPLASIKTMIANGTYNPITGKAGAIISSTALTNASGHKTALGYGEASALGVGSFQGQSVDSTSILIRYTYVGDANLDGRVNALDFNMLASNYGHSPGNETWTQGDFNADGSVNTLDFMGLASNFNQPPLSAPSLGTVVPEPGMLSLPLLLSASLRRRIRQSQTDQNWRSFCPGSPRI